MAKRRSTGEPQNSYPFVVVIVILHLLTFLLIGIDARVPTQAIVDVNLSEIGIIRLDIATIALLAAMAVSQTLIPTKVSRKHCKNLNMVVEASAPHSLVNITIHSERG